MKKLFYLSMAVILFAPGTFVNAQGVGINDYGAPPDPSASLDVSGTAKGVLINRMPQSERDQISNPALGLQVFNTTTNCINIWIGNGWKQLCGDCSLSAPVVGSNSPVCTGAELDLTATGASGATYQWAGPNGFSSTNQNPVITNVTGAAVGIYSVTQTKDGCTSQSQLVLVTVNTTPASLGASNNGPLCASGNLTLLSNVISGAVYNWSGPNGFTSTAQNPVINNVTSVNAGTYYLTATINGCASPVDSTALVVLNGIPLQPDVISGNALNLGGQNAVAYSITPVDLAAYYVWTVPNGVTLATGQGSTAITANYTCSGDGNVGITANNACGTSPQQNLYVSTDLYVPGAITGNAFVCPNTSQTYSIAAVPYAMAYTWSVPVGTTITSGQNTTSITINVGTASGDISVTETGLCGTSAPSVLTIANGIPTFSFSPSTGIVGGVPVTFTPVSNYPGIIYNWTFDQGSPSSSSSQNPVVTWPAQVSQTSFNAQLSVNGCPAAVNPVVINIGAFYGYTGAIQTFTVPAGVTSITIEADGAQGGNHSPGQNYSGNSYCGCNGGNGADIIGTFAVTPGDVYNIIVGQQGVDQQGGNVGNGGAGGGGGSFVYGAGPNLLIAAGGGGGGALYDDAFYNNYPNAPVGDDGQTGNCGSQSRSCWAGGCGGSDGSGDLAGSGWNTIQSNPAGIGYGGYGGGGSAEYHGGGGGGGYSGGGGAGGTNGCGANYGDGGGGGGSYNTGTNQINTGAFQSGNGQVVITY